MQRDIIFTALQDAYKSHGFSDEEAIDLDYPTPEEVLKRIEKKEQERRIYNVAARCRPLLEIDRKSTRLNSSHSQISYAVFCFTKQIFTGLVVGIVIGFVVSRTNPGVAVYFKPFRDLFLRLIKMIIAPLIFATLVPGIAGAGHA